MAKKYFQKALSVGLSLALCAGLAAPAFAASFSELNEAINSTENRTFGENNDITASTDENGVRNVTLNGDVINSGNEDSITIGGGKNVNLDLNGNDIVNTGDTANRSTIWVNGGTLTLDDHSNDANSSEEVGAITGGTGSGIWVENGGGLIMNDGEISGNHSKSGSHGGGVHVNDANSSFTMNGGAITDNTADGQGGGVFVQNGTFTMNGGEITKNTANFGGGVNTVGGTVNMTDGTINGNTARKDGSDVWVKAEAGKDASFEMKGGAINGSNADGKHTVGVDGNGNASFNVNGGTLTSSDNAASDILVNDNGTVNYGRNDNGGLRDIADDEADLEKSVNADNSRTELNIEYPPAPESPVVDPADPVEVTIDEPAVPLAAGPVTRAEFIDYLWRHENEPENAGVCTFTDVTEEHEYFAALCWAEEDGVAEAYFNAEGHEDGTFEPDELVTVAAVREFLDNFARVFGTNAVAAADLTSLIGDDDEAVLNCDEVLAEFFGEEYIPAGDEDEAA